MVRALLFGFSRFLAGSEHMKKDEGEDTPSMVSSSPAW
jgi:hypothetical protein